MCVFLFFFFCFLHDEVVIIACINQSRVNPALFTFVGRRFKDPEDASKGVVQAVVLETVGRQICFSYRPVLVLEGGQGVSEGGAESEAKDGEDEDEGLKYVGANYAMADFEWAAITATTGGASESSLTTAPVSAGGDGDGGGGAVDDKAAALFTRGNRNDICGCFLCRILFLVAAVCHCSLDAAAPKQRADGGGSVEQEQEVK